MYLQNTADIWITCNMAFWVKYNLKLASQTVFLKADFADFNGRGLSGFEQILSIYYIKKMTFLSLF